MPAVVKDSIGETADRTLIPADHFFDRLEAVAAHSDLGRSACIRLGETMRCEDYGAFGLAFKSSPDLLGAFKRVERYGRVVTNVANFDVEIGCDEALMAVCTGDDERLGALMTNELAIAAATALCREVSRGSFNPDRVVFSHAAPKDLEPYQAYFKCPVEFGQLRDGLYLRADQLRVPNAVADDSIASFFDALLEKELSDVGTERSIDELVLEHLLKSLSEGAPTLDQTASALGLGVRTLQRRLSDCDVIYEALVTEARRRLAHRLLTRSDYGLAEIAFLTGYSEQSAFNRAFKRWYGQTPSDYRKQLGVL